MEKKTRAHTHEPNDTDWIARKTRSTLNPNEEERLREFSVSNSLCACMLRKSAESLGGGKERISKKKCVCVFFIARQKKIQIDIKEACNLDKNMPLTAVIVKCCSEIYLKYAMCLCVYMWIVCIEWIRLTQCSTGKTIFSHSYSPAACVCVLETRACVNTHQTKECTVS